MEKYGFVMNYPIGSHREPLNELNDILSVLLNNYSTLLESEYILKGIENNFNQELTDFKRPKCKLIDSYKSTGFFVCNNNNFKNTPGFFEYLKVYMEKNEIDVEKSHKVKFIEQIFDYNILKAEEFLVNKLREIKLEEKALTFKVEITAINCDKKKRKQEILDLSCRIFQPEFKVKLEEPDLVIFVFIIRNFMGISVYKNYKKN